jgi:DNA-binding SARP family transcriptional activator
VEYQAGRQPQVYPGSFVSDRSEWYTIQEHLKSQQYEEAALVLQKLKSIAEQKDDNTQANILAAAHQICLTCNQNQEEIRSRQQSLALAAERLQEMQAQLQAVLKLVEEPDCWQPDAAQTASSPNNNDQEEEKETAFWQRVWHFLSSSFAPQTEAPEVVTPTPSPPSDDTLLETPVEIQPDSPDPTLVVHCLGVLRVYCRDRLINDWNGLKGQMVFKYLLFRRKRPIAKDILMDMFWHDMEPEAARRNLHQAIYSLRQTLKQSSSKKQQYILFENDSYYLNPDITTWLDFEAFEQYVHQGRRLEAAGKVAEAMTKYGIAEGLYQGDFLEDDLYEDWTNQPRLRFRQMYLEVTDRLSEYYCQQQKYSGAIALCQKLLARDSCHEPAHRRLMRCYQAQRQRHLAVRQYHTCREQLKQELDLAPAPETEALYRQLTA